MKLLSLNIEGHNHLDRIIPFLEREQPDVVTLQEVFKADLPRLAEAFGEGGPAHISFAPMVNVDRQNRMDFPFLGELGIAILSKNKPQQTHQYYYVGSPEDIPHVTMDPNLTNRVVLASKFVIRDSYFVVATTHFTWAPDGSTTTEQHHDLNKLLIELDKLPPHILTGDFNAPRSSDIWQRLTSRYTDHIPTDIPSTLDPILHRAGPLNLVVDGLFSTPTHYHVSNVQVPSHLSDHQAIFCTIDKHLTKF